MNKTIVINDIEPAMLSFRHPLGINLDLTVKMQNQNGTARDPTLAQFVLLPRSRGGVYPYDMEATDVVNGIASVKVPGASLTDVSGYNIELYARKVNEVPGDPPLPTGLLARGVLVTEGSAYGSSGPMNMINIPVVVGPPGEQGIQGIQGIQGPEGDPSTIPGPQGQQGIQGETGPANVLTVGTVTTGAPGSPASVTITGTPPAQVIDFVIPAGLTGATGSNITLGTALPGSATDGALFWNTTTNTLYVREAGVWVPVEATWA